MPDKMTPASISKQATGSLLPNAHNNALASDIGTKSGPSQIKRFAMTAAPAAIISVSYTHLRAHEDQRGSRMPSSA